MHQDEYYRARNCRILILSSTKPNHCSSCVSHNVKVVAAKIRNECKMLQPAKLKAAIKFTSPERVELTLQNERLKCKQLESQIAEMKPAIENHSEHVNPELSRDLISLFTGCDKKRFHHL